MREIKFRGLRHNGEWIYGVPVGRGTYIFPVDIIGTNNFELYAVKKETIGEFTGLLDKNGKEIYEGDVIHLDFQGVKMDGHVKQAESGEWIFYKDEGNFLGVHHNLGRLEIIGNIYEEKS